MSGDTVGVVDGVFWHKCVEDGCDRNVEFDDEPRCFTHSPDEGSSVRGWSAYAEYQKALAETNHPSLLKPKKKPPVRVTFRIPANENETFVVDDLARLTGQKANFESFNGSFDIPILDAALVEDGRGIDITIELPAPIRI